MTTADHPRPQAALRRIVAFVEERVTRDRLDRLAGPEEQPGDDAERFRRITRRVFGLGLQSWVVARRWPATMAALEGAEPAAVARLSAVGEARFLANPAVIRNAAKLAATVHNAAVVVALGQTYGDLVAYAHAVAGDGADELVRDIGARFRLVGEVSAARVAQELGLDIMVPHPAARRVLDRIAGERPANGAVLRSWARAAAPGYGGPFPCGRLGAALLAFGAGRWGAEPICTAEPACDDCPAGADCSGL